MSVSSDGGPGFTKLLTFACAGLLMATLSACATVPPASDPAAVKEYEARNDPLEPMNRYFFEVNKGLDMLLIHPFSEFYRVGVPDPIQTRIHYFLLNLTSPVTFANDLLQGNGTIAGHTLTRFLINTTLGIGGLFDVASDWGYPYHEEDFGQTLAVHGVDPGPYLMLPLLGPSNPRDLVGTVVDIFLDPLTYLTGGIGDPHHLQLIRYAATVIDFRTQNRREIDDLYKNSLDPYATVRDIYRQHRAQEIRNTEQGVEGIGSTSPPAPGGGITLDEN